MKNWLHHYLGCVEVVYDRYSEYLQSYVRIQPRLLNEDCLLTIKMLYGEHSLINIKPLLIPITALTDSQKAELNIKDGSGWENPDCECWSVEQVGKLYAWGVDLHHAIENGYALDRSKIDR